MFGSPVRFLMLGALALALLGLCRFGPVAIAASTAPARPAAAATRIDAAPPIALASHRAVYDLTLAKSVGSKSPTAAHGRIAFDFAGSPCEGYAQNFRQFTELQPAEGPTRVSDMHSATFEDAEGKSFDFKMETRVDNGAPEVVDGKASKTSDGPVSVALSKPTRTNFNLPAKVVFPTEHLKKIIGAAQAGKNLLEAKVFDGSETGEKVFDTTTFIGQVIAAPAIEPAAHIPQLERLRRWPVSISYFESGKMDQGPSYTLAFDLYENGVSRALKLDYGDFVLAGEMSSLELLNEAECSK